MVLPVIDIEYNPPYPSTTLLKFHGSNQNQMQWVDLLCMNNWTGIQVGAAVIFQRQIDSKGMNLDKIANIHAQRSAIFL